jgi:hypothetical protein
MKAQSRSDAATVFGQQMLDGINMVDAVGNMNAQNNVL